MSFLDNAFKTVVTFAAVDQLSKTVQNMGQNLGVLDSQSKQTLKTLDKFKTIGAAGAGITAVGVAGAKAMENLADKAGDVQMKLIQLGNVFGLNIDDTKLKQLEKQAEQLSSKTLFSKKEILGIDLELAHAGITQQAIERVLPEATYLAEVEVGMGKSGSANSTAYNFARMSEDAGITGDVKRMSTFADNINRMISVTHANTQTLGEGFKYAMPVVKNLGWSENDVLMAMGMAARSGIEGSMAGTHIKDFAERINPFKYLNTRGGQKQLTAMEDMGLLSGIEKEYSKNGSSKIVGFQSAALLKDKDHLKSYGEMVDILSKKYQDFIAKGANGQEYLNEMSQEDIDKLQEKSKLMTGGTMSGGALQWAAMANHLWGEQGQDFAIISSHKELYERLKKQMDIQKNLHKQIEDIRESWQGVGHILVSNIENVLIQIGKPIMDILIPRIKKVGEAFGSLMEFLADNPQIAKTIGFIMAIGTGLALIIGPALVLVGTIGFMVPLLEAGFAVLSAVFAAAIAPILITLGVILAVAAAGYLIYKNWGAIKTFFINLWTSIKVIAGSVWNWLATNWKTIVTVILLAMGPIGWVFLWIIRVIRTNWDSIVKFLKDSVEWVKKAWIPISKFFSELWDGIKSAAASAWRWIVDEVKAAIKEISNSPVVKWIIETGGKVVKGISDWTFGADNESDMKSGITPTKNNSDKLLGLYRQSDKGNGKNGGNMTVGDINITTQPGQNSKEIAKEVIKELGRDSRNKQMSRGSEPVMAWP